MSRWEIGFAISCPLTLTPCSLFWDRDMLRRGRHVSPGGEGTLNGGFVAALLLWIPAYAGKTVRGGFAVGVGEAVADKVLGGFEAVVDFDAGGFAVQGVGEKARDVFTVFGEGLRFCVVSWFGCT